LDQVYFWEIVIQLVERELDWFRWIIFSLNDCFSEIMFLRFGIYLALDDIGADVEFAV
jgi:hypothetical protein